MARWQAAAVLALVVSLALADPSHRPAAAQTATTLRIATLAPRGSTWHRVFTAWSNSLRARSGGQLEMQVIPASPGQERALVRQLRAGEIDGACFTAIGVGELAQQALVLQAPGAFEGYEALDRARAAMDAELRGLFERNGVTLMGWADYGRGRVFSTRPVAQPGDLRGMRFWVPPGDAMSTEFARVVGATPTALEIGEVGGALNAGRLDALVATAAAVSALQWHTRLTHVMSPSSAVLVGATLFSKARVDALSAELREALVGTAAQAHQALQRSVRQDDERFYAALTSRHGVSPVDASPHEAAWRQVARTTRERLVGRLYPRDLLERAMAAGR